jgi:hypothetical protein
MKRWTAALAATAASLVLAVSPALGREDAPKPQPRKAKEAKEDKGEKYERLLSEKEKLQALILEDQDEIDSLKEDANQSDDLAREAEKDHRFIDAAELREAARASRKLARDLAKQDDEHKARIREIDAEMAKIGK